MSVTYVESRSVLHTQNSDIVDYTAVGTLKIYRLRGKHVDRRKKVSVSE